MAGGSSRFRFSIPPFVAWLWKEGVLYVLRSAIEERLRVYTCNNYPQNGSSASHLMPLLSISPSCSVLHCAQHSSWYSHIFDLHKIPPLLLLPWWLIYDAAICIKIVATRLIISCAESYKIATRCT